jgi:hypothetical protein
VLGLLSRPGRSMLGLLPHAALQLRDRQAGLP